MRRKVARCLLFVLAALVFYGGAGVNVMSYCCNHCRDAGVEVVLENRCCEIHGHHSNPQEAPGVCDASAHRNGCEIKHLEFDWTCAQSFLTNLQPLAIDLLSVRWLVSLLPSPQARELFVGSSAGPPACSPRMYLSFLTVLLI